MGYIEELRERIGNRPVILVSAAVLILDARECLLLVRRSDNGSWGPPGGMMEPGETLEETARRETHEETGLVVGVMQMLGVFSGPELYYRYPNGDEVYNVTAAYVTGDVSGEIQVDPAEHTEMGYFELERLPEPVSPPIRPILAHFLQERAGSDRADRI
jgi:8-oxo-dGTP pyrophosphatase MutT (NUDIX family)